MRRPLSHPPTEAAAPTGALPVSKQPVGQPPRPPSEDANALSHNDTPQNDARTARRSIQRFYRPPTYDRSEVVALLIPGALAVLSCVLVAWVPSGDPLLVGALATNLIAFAVPAVGFFGAWLATPGRGVPVQHISKQRPDDTVSVVAGIAGAVLTAALVGFGLFFAVLNQHGYDAFLDAYRPHGGLLEDFWQPLSWALATAFTAVWVLLTCAVYLYSPWPIIKVTCARLMAAGTLVLLIAAGIAVYQFLLAVNLSVRVGQS